MNWLVFLNLFGKIFTSSGVEVSLLAWSELSSVEGVQEPEPEPFWKCGLVLDSLSSEDSDSELSRKF